MLTGSALFSLIIGKEGWGWEGCVKGGGRGEAGEKGRKEGVLGCIGGKLGNILLRMKAHYTKCNLLKIYMWT